MIRSLPLAFILALLAELASIILVGQNIGVLATLLAIVAGGFLGSTVIRLAGVGLADVMRRPDFDAKFATRGAARQFLLLLAGLLFISPGFFSDVLALLLLPVIVRDWLAAKIMTRVTVHGAAWQRPRHRPPLIIEGEIIDRNE